MDPLACNYNPDATCSGGGCTYPTQGAWSYGPMENNPSVSGCQQAPCGGGTYPSQDACCEAHPGNTPGCPQT